MMLSWSKIRVNLLITNCGSLPLNRRISCCTGDTRDFDFAPRVIRAFKPRFSESWISGIFFPENGGLSWVRKSIFGINRENCPNSICLIRARGHWGPFPLWEVFEGGRRSGGSVREVEFSMKGLLVGFFFFGRTLSQVWFFLPSSPCSQKPKLLMAHASPLMYASSSLPCVAFPTLLWGWAIHSAQRHKKIKHTRQPSCHVPHSTWTMASGRWDKRGASKENSNFNTGVLWTTLCLLVFSQKTFYVNINFFLITYSVWPRAVWASQCSQEIAH